MMSSLHTVKQKQCTGSSLRRLVPDGQTLLQTPIELGVHALVSLRYSAAGKPQVSRRSASGLKPQVLDLT